MSIPERLYRLARGKIGEIRDMFDSPDAEIDPELLARVQRAQARKSARQELDDATDTDNNAQSSATLAVPPVRESSTLRTPSEIRGNSRADTAPLTNTGQTGQDPLAAHYRLLGLEPGADYAAVQAVYEKLAARCKADRFPPGSAEAREAQDIEDRLEATYKVLREALDPTTRRFDMLEI